MVWLLDRPDDITHRFQNEFVCAVEILMSGAVPSPLPPPAGPGAGNLARKLACVRPADIVVQSVAIRIGHFQRGEPLRELFAGLLRHSGRDRASALAAGRPERKRRMMRATQPNRRVKNHQRIGGKILKARCRIVLATPSELRTCQKPI